MSWGIEHGTVTFGAKTAVDDVTLKAVPGSVTVVVGGDGAGKSTLLRALVGLVRLSSGTARRPAKRAIGYIPAMTGLYVDLTVEENLSFIGRAYGLTGPEYVTRSAELLERIGLTEARDRLGSQLSGGMQRKLAVASALFHDPELLVLDEPTTGVDPVSRVELWRLISGAVARDTAAVLTTSYVDEANRGSSVLLMDQGRAIASGSPSDIIAAIPGAVGVVRGPLRPKGSSWRAGSNWRVWAPSDALPDGAEAVTPTFHDAVMIASLVGAAQA
ncbi:MAG: ABC transporter ATP-binding protein [Candidatus Dormiibacterota bacterium]|jgi:ABC-2 type transport system ATP-binding protein